LPLDTARGRALALLRSRISRWRALRALLPAAGKPLVAAGVLLNVTIGLLPLVFIVAMGVLLHRLSAQPQTVRWAGIAPVFAVAVAGFVLQQALAPFQAGVGEVIARRIDQHCIDRLMTATLRDAPIATLERPESLDLLAGARFAFAREAISPGEGAAALLPLMARYLQLAGSVTLIAVVLSPIPAALIGVTALATRFGVRGTLGRFAQLWESLGRQQRRVSYLRGLATTAAAAKEVRLLGLLPWLRGRLRRDTMAGLEPLWAGSRKLQFWPFVWLAVVGLIGGATALGLLASAAAGGGVSVLSFAVALQAVLIPMRFGVHFPECDVQTQYGILSLQALEKFEAELADGHRAVPPGTAAAVAPQHAIRFENVSFRYTDDGPWVLHDLDLEIPAGRSTALVGLNGAGKTTLIKLLARLYEPTRGRITVDGQDLSAVDPRLWQDQLSLIFQDYVRYELTAAENIGLGFPRLLTDEAAILAAAQRAGATKVLDTLPDPLRTPLSPRYPGGQDLSGGQWQRIALARAMLAVRGGASVMVLDEPAAQLDIRAEAELFDRIITGAGKVTCVLVSHRFATVRHADLIVVVEHGRVVEQGDHATLLDLGGRYAELFELQARRFRSETVEEPAR
jgi:ATP-binding cassette subfamily B protein